MVQLRKDPSRRQWEFTAAMFVAASGLRCTSPSTEGLFEATARLSPSAGTGGGAGAELPGTGGMESAAPSAGGSAAVNPPASGFGGAPESPPQRMGAAGAVGSSGGAMGSSGGASGAPVVVDAGVEPSPPCVLGAFGSPEPLTGLEQGLNSDLQQNFWSPTLSADGRTLFFAISVNGGDEQIATATRPDRGTVFSAAVGVSSLNSAGQEGTPLLSSDGLTLYFYSTRAGGPGKTDLWFSTRPSRGDEFTAPALMAGVNAPEDDHLPWVSPDQLTLLWSTNRDGGVGGYDIWIARRAFASDGFSSIAPLNGVNSTSTEGRAVLTNDQLTMYFASDRPGGTGSLDLWVAERSTAEGSFAKITNLADLNSSGMDLDPFLSVDERELMFASDRGGQVRLWRSVRECE